MRGEALFLLPATLFLLTLALYPFIELIRMSLSDVTVYDIFKSWPFIGLKGVQSVASTFDFREAAANSVIYVLLVVGVGLGGGSPPRSPCGVAAGWPDSRSR